MEISTILQNVLAPPVLFFLIGAISVLFKSDLEIPAPLPKLFSLYLLLAIGFKGGIEIQKSGFTDQVLPTLSAAILMSLLIPLIGFLILDITDVPRLGVTATLAIEDMMQEAKNNSRKAFVAGANEKVKDRLAKFGVEGIIETRKEALETALNEIA